MKGDVTPKHAPPFAPKSESIWAKVWHYALTWEGTCFYTNIKNHLFCIKIKWAFRSWGPFWRREHVELVAGQLGRVDRVDLEPLEMGAFPLRGGGIPLTRWGHFPYEMGTFPLPDGDISLTRWVWGARASSGGRPLDRVVCQLGRVARMRKNKGERINLPTQIVHTT